MFLRATALVRAMRLGIIGGSPWATQPAYVYSSRPHMYSSPQHSIPRCHSTDDNNTQMLLDITPQMWTRSHLDSTRHSLHRNALLLCTSTSQTSVLPSCSRAHIEAVVLHPPHVCAHLALLVSSFTSRVRRALHISRSASRSRLVPQRSCQRRCLLEHRCSIAVEPHLRVGLSNDRQGLTRLDAEGVLDLTHLEREEGGQ